MTATATSVTSAAECQLCSDTPLLKQVTSQYQGADLGQNVYCQAPISTVPVRWFPTFQLNT